MVEVLARRKKNDPVLIGEPGVGKTAIVEGLAQRMINGDVPETLRNKRLVELSVNSLVAGAKYRGEFEERVKALMEEISAHRDALVLFVDEVHTIVGAGQGGGEGGLDIANVFKPAMARGELKGRGAGTSFSAGSRLGADRRTNGEYFAWPARSPGGPPSRDNPRRGICCCCRVVGPIHHGTFSSRQGSRLDRPSIGTRTPFDHLPACGTTRA